MMKMYFLNIDSLIGFRALLEKCEIFVVFTQFFTKNLTIQKPFDQSKADLIAL